MPISKIIFISLFLLFQSIYSYAEIKIKYKIGEKIITNIDIIHEKNYLIFLRPNLQELDNNEILRISGNSLIREIIKRKEIDNIFKNVNNLKFIEDIKKNLFAYKNVKNEEEFILLLEKNNIGYERIIEKMKYEGLWNELIYRKFNSLVKIDKEKLKEELKIKISKNKKYEYNLSELLFEVDDNETFKNKHEKIIKNMSKTNFKSTTAKYSISNSANKGGDIGWVKETILSENLNKILKNIKIGEITDPIKYPNGYLILKINDKKEMKQIVNINKELNERIKFERNKQLNQFSLLFYKKLKQNTVINEY